jgi:hypothetical protein
MNRLLLLFLMFIWVAANGQLGFSDQAGLDAEVHYTEFMIASPIADEGVRANNGNVLVQLLLQPALHPPHVIVLRVDGEAGKSGSDLTIELNNLARGKHTVMATVVDGEGNELIQTDPVSFFVLRVAGG